MEIFRTEFLEEITKPNLTSQEDVSHYCCGYYGRAFGAGSAQLTLKAKPYWSPVFENDQTKPGGS